MRDKRTSGDNFSQNRPHGIPDLDIIDLERDTLSDSEEITFPETDSPEAFDAPAEQDGRKKKGILSRINIHIVLLAVAVIFVVGVVYKFKNWGRR